MVNNCASRLADTTALPYRDDDDDGGGGGGDGDDDVDGTELCCS